MDDIFHLVRDGNALAVRLWLDSIENDFNLGDDHGFSLLHWACWDGRLNIVDLLISRGAKINSLNKGEDTPLHCAAQKNHLEVVNLLIRNKANINALNIHGNSALHYACHYNYCDLSIELVKYGGLLTICNRYNQTPIDLCRKPFKERLIMLAKSLNLDLMRISFKEDENWRWSRSRMKETNFSQNIGINIDELPVEKMIDSNHGGTTWKGFWQGAEVIIKVLKVKETNQKIASSFNQEYKKLRIFNFANILPVLGACISLPDLIIVSQYMYFGSLYNLLHEQSEFAIDFGQMIGFAINIAKGMEYLHNLDSITNNFDLNSKHVMIDEDLTAKISMTDYKFTFCDKTRVHNPAWMAPEALRKKVEDINKKSADMWSFAIILWELHSREIPFGQYSAMQCGRMILNDGLRLPLPTDNQHMQKLIRICMNEDPAKRPKFEMIIPILEKFKNTTASPSSN